MEKNCGKKEKKWKCGEITPNYIEQPRGHKIVALDL